MSSAGWVRGDQPLAAAGDGQTLLLLEAVRLGNPSG